MFPAGWDACAPQVPSFPGPSKNVGIYGPSFGPLCTVTFEAERERAPEKNIRRSEDLIERVRPAAQRQQILSGYCSFFREKR